jgi:hypothetical protein
MAPSAIDVQSRNTGSQKSHDPHLEQKPRRTFSDDWNQVIISSPVTLSASFGRLAEAK